jgi:prepilin-type N-terminal cleavage/methylation domain-containing protein
MRQSQTIIPRPTTRNRHNGFTLVELLVVISVLGVLAAVVVFAVGGVTDRGESASCAADARVLRTAEESHFAKTGTYVDMDGLVTAGLLAKPSSINSISISAGKYSIVGTGACASAGGPVLADSFEAAPAAPGSSWALWSAGSSPGGWTVNSGSIDIVDYRFWGNPALTGLSALNTIDLHGGSVGSIQRDITGLKIGQTYSLSMKYAVNSAPGSSARFRIANLDTTLVANNSAYNTEWKSATYQFTASATSHTLRIDGAGSNPWGGVTLDDITVK